MFMKTDGKTTTTTGTTGTGGFQLAGVLAASRELQDAAQRGDRDGISASLAKLNKAWGTATGLKTMPRSTGKGTPQQEGLPGAVHDCATLLRDTPDFPKKGELGNPDELDTKADQLATWQNMQSSATAESERLTRNIAPLSVDLYDEVKLISTTFTPLYDSDEQFGPVVARINDYLNGRHQRGAGTRHRNKRRDAKLATKIASDIGARARTEARTQAEGAVTDALSSLLKKDK